ncbi:hypothetical protein JCM15457_202 [Liquorilactobacillus sucicola DSM 21376 = JCM 15457]|uniref:UPF0223 family protein n=1 Tax=Liquorilactobacillus sucicola TaxID=519050 RepID=UPI000436CBEF|nr:UPF0223 family protein [Liquorilactobacillus sucicola]GAJ25342.1 hypothetical protein JCM15457_202 [Liquorilactobacillus sucicola DSM 21376 = JCM 15457]
MVLPRNISYPLRDEWSTEDIIKATEFYFAVEQLYTSKIERSVFLDKYADFIETVPMKMTQKQLDREFYQLSGLSIYHAVQFAQKNKKRYLHLEI